ELQCRPAEQGAGGSRASRSTSRGRPVMSERMPSSETARGFLGVEAVDLGRHLADRVFSVAFELGLVEGFVQCDSEVSQSCRVHFREPAAPIGVAVRNRPAVPACLHMKLPLYLTYGSGTVLPHFSHGSL